MLTTPTEDEDIAAAREGDHTAFERIFRRHVVKVHALATWLGAERARICTNYARSLRASMGPKTRRPSIS